MKESKQETPKGKMFLAIVGGIVSALLILSIGYVIDYIQNGRIEGESSPGVTVVSGETVIPNEIVVAGVTIFLLILLVVFYLLVRSRLEQY